MQFKAFNTKKKRWVTDEVFINRRGVYANEENLLAGITSNESIRLSFPTFLRDRANDIIYTGDIVLFDNGRKMVVELRDGYYNVANYNIKTCQIIGSIYDGEYSK